MSENTIETETQNEERSEDKNPKKNRDQKRQDEIEKQSKRYKEGQILTFVKVRFPGNARSFAFTTGNRTLDHGQRVVAMSDRGMAVGYVNSFCYEIPFSKELLPIRAISKVASDEDLEVEKDHYRKEKETETLCTKLIKKHKLDMNLTHVEFTQFGKKTIFYFTAPQRVDFRGLVRDLVGELKCRVELRQISLRDRSAAIGGIGPCGRQLCCSSFLSQYGNVSVKMAKNQNLTLNSSKINGVCGQLKCCLQYEDVVYTHKRKKLPREGKIIKVATGEIGKVTRLHVLNEEFEMITEKGARKRYSVGQYLASEKPPQGYKFPDRFEHISNDLGQVVGKEEDLLEKKDLLEEDLQELQSSGSDHVTEVWSGLPEYTKREDGKVFVAQDLASDESDARE